MIDGYIWLGEATFSILLLSLLVYEWDKSRKVQPPDSPIRDVSIERITVNLGRIVGSSLFASAGIAYLTGYFREYVLELLLIGHAVVPLMAFYEYHVFRARLTGDQLWLYHGIDSRLKQSCYGLQQLHRLWPWRK